MLPIPAHNGVFMAALCSEQPLVNVRTFIRDSQLSERQLALKEKLARAMRGDEHALIEWIAANCVPGSKLRSFYLAFARSAHFTGVARACNDARYKSRRPEQNRDVYRRRLLPFSDSTTPCIPCMTELGSVQCRWHSENLMRMLH
jgi:hypothetical protein